MPFAQTPRARIHFVVDGPPDAPAVLLIHPLGASLTLWDEHAAALQDRYRVVRFDLRGHAMSPPVPGDYAIDDLGRDAVAVMDAAGVETAHVVGILVTTHLKQEPDGSKWNPTPCRPIT